MQFLIVSHTVHSPIPGQSKVGCRFPRWLSSAAHWRSLDTVRAPEDHSGPPGQRPGRVSRVSMSVSSANASFIDLRVSSGLGETALADQRPLYYGEEEEEGSTTVLCHKREKMTTVGERVVRLILYQTKGW